MMSNVALNLNMACIFVFKCCYPGNCQPLQRCLKLQPVFLIGFMLSEQAERDGQEKYYQTAGDYA